MPTDVIMPQMGESIFEGTLTKWLKKPGEKVTRDEPLFEISTDKVDAEIPAPASGVLKEVKVKEGTTVQVNTVVGVIDGDGAGAAASAPSAPLKQLLRPRPPAQPKAAQLPPMDRRKRTPRPRKKPRHRQMELHQAAAASFRAEWWWRRRHGCHHAADGRIHL